MAVVGCRRCDDGGSGGAPPPTLLPQRVLAPLALLPQVLLLGDEQARVLVHHRQSFFPDGLPVPLQRLRRNQAVICSGGGGGKRCVGA